MPPANHNTLSQEEIDNLLRETQEDSEWEKLRSSPQSRQELEAEKALLDIHARAERRVRVRRSSDTGGDYYGIPPSMAARRSLPDVECPRCHRASPAGILYGPPLPVARPRALTWWCPACREGGVVPQALSQPSPHARQPRAPREGL